MGTSHGLTGQEVRSAYDVTCAYIYIITVCVCVRVPACEQNRSWAQMRGHVLSSDLRRCAPVPNEQEGHHYTRLILHRDLKPKNFFVTGGGPEAQPSSPFAVSIAVKIAVVFPSDVPRHGRFKMTAGSLQLGDFGLAKKMDNDLSLAGGLANLSA